MHACEKAAEMPAITALPTGLQLELFFLRIFAAAFDQ